MRRCAWPRPNDPTSTPSIWQRRKKKRLGNEIVLDRRPLIQVDLPKQLFAVEFERTEVMFTVRVVVGDEGVEGSNRADRTGDEFQSERRYAVGRVGLAQPSIEGTSADRIVERGNPP